MILGLFYLQMNRSFVKSNISYKYPYERHSHASMLVDMGVAPLEIAERLGHEKVETTLNTYSHLYPSTQSKLADLLDKKHEEEEE